MKFTKALIYLNLFFLQSYLIRFHIGNYPTNLQEIFLGIMTVTFIGKTIMLQRSTYKSKQSRSKGLSYYQKSFSKNLKKHWILVSLALLTILSLLLVPIFNFIDLARHVKFLFFGIIFTYIFIETLNKKTEQEKALKMAGYGAIAFGLFSVIYNLTGHNIAHDLRLLGPLDAAVYLGFYLTPFFIYFSIKSFNKPKKINIIPAITLGLLIIATKSMGAIGGSFLILVIYLFKNHSNKIRQNRTLKTIITILAIGILATIISTKILPTLNTEYSSLDERGEIWKISEELLKTPRNLLLGVGFGQFEHHYIENADQVLGQPPLDYNVIQPHNIFLLFTFHYGILGLILIVFLISKTLMQIIKNPKLKEFDQIILLTLLYFFIHGLIDTPFFKNDMIILLLIYLELGLMKVHQLNPSK